MLKRKSLNLKQYSVTLHVKLPLKLPILNQIFCISDFFMIGQLRFEELLSRIFMYSSCTFDLSSCHHSCAPIKLEVKFSPQGVCRQRVRTLLILDLGGREACVVNATPRPLYPWQSPINLVSLLTRIRFRHVEIANN